MGHYRQAIVLSQQFDTVIANPPYMGRKYQDPVLKEFGRDRFSESWHDLFAMFMQRGLSFCKSAGISSMVTMQSWMFLSSLSEMRERALRENTLTTLLHMGNGVMGIAFGTSASVFFKARVGGYNAGFSYCENSDVNELGVPETFPIRNPRLLATRPDEFKKIPGSPVAYWVSDEVRNAFAQKSLGSVATTFQGIITGDNAQYVRSWFELSRDLLNISLKSLGEFRASPHRYWVPYNKGGEGIRWYGNQELVVNFREQGRNFTRGKHQFSDFFFKPCFSWTYISSSTLATRYFPSGFIWDVHGSSAFPDADEDAYFLMALVGSKVGRYLLNIINPTISFQVENIAAVPVVDISGEEKRQVIDAAIRCVEYAKADWDCREISWTFSTSSLIAERADSIGSAFKEIEAKRNFSIRETMELEEAINKVFLRAYKLEDEVSAQVQEGEVTLTSAERDVEAVRLVSHAIGCMMGRYSLDEPGLVFASAGNNGFEAVRYKLFPADVDGILPLTSELWFEDDAANRIGEFLRSVWGESTLTENIDWVAESLGRKGNETSEEAVRRYLSDRFFKDHLQTYKRRPIYWLFSSGKLGAFQALVYLHRYNAGTLARMRAEYVVPLTGKMQSRIEQLERDVASAASTAVRNRINKQLESLRKQHLELLAYDEQLRHYADQRIELDLDDGVKVNYGKFGDLLADVKSVVGKQEED